MRRQFFRHCGGSAWSEKEGNVWIIRCDRNGDHSTVNASFTETKWEWNQRFGLKVIRRQDEGR